VQSDVKLTRTGDLMGTLRYMSPEQALGGRGVVDQRADVYSLGATLYELLTLEPAFPGDDAKGLLRRIAEDEPRPPRRIARAVPAELETIVLKAMEKNPADRYATAQALADDLRRFLHDQPIQARRPSLAQRLGKWRRRHKALCWSVAVTALIAVLMLWVAGGWWAWQRAAVERETLLALDESRRFQEQEKWPEALSSARRAEALAKAGPAGDELQRRAERRRAELEMVARIEEIRLPNISLRAGHFNMALIDPAYDHAFRDWGIDVTALGPEEAGTRIRATGVAVEMAAALDAWAIARKETRGKGDATWRDLLATARAADPDDWRNRVRDALERSDLTGLKELASSERADELPASTIVLIVNILRDGGIVDQERELLLRAQRTQPGDFWVNHQLAEAFLRSKPPQWEEAIRYFSVAAALRPQSAGPWVNLGIALDGAGRLDEAIAACKQGVRCKPDSAAAHSNLGNMLRRKGRLDEAIVECQEAVRRDKDLPFVHIHLGCALAEKDRLDEAIAEFREAIRLDGLNAQAHHNLGHALRDKRCLDEAIIELREAIRLDGDDPSVHFDFGLTLRRKGLRDEAIKEYREAIRLKGNRNEFHVDLGNALADKGDLDEAVTEFQEAIRINKNDERAHSGLGAALASKGRLDEAIAEFREAIRNNKDYAPAHSYLGKALTFRGELEEAVTEYREAIRIDKDHAKDHADTHADLGAALLAKGESEAAITEFREAVRLDSNLAAAHRGLGAALASKQMLEEAITEFREAVRLKEDDAYAHIGLGRVLAEKGQFREAEKELRRARELGSQTPRRP
jgi:tetratricopeptide (TPR) repeat protein